VLQNFARCLDGGRNMMIKRFVLFSFFLVLMLNQTFAARLDFKKNRAAKVGDRVFLKSEVKEAMRQSKVSYEQALDDLINFEVLYQAAKIRIPIPEEKAVLELIKEEKQYYALHFRREAESISDQEFLNSVGFKNRSMRDYRDYTIKRIMVEQYLNVLYTEAELKNNTISQEEIDNFIKDNPRLFKKSETYDLMLIYFSFFSKEGRELTKSEISDKCKTAEECLGRLKGGADFSQIAKTYSEDLYSLRQSPIGYYGKVERDDEYTKKRFSGEILDTLAGADMGLIERLFATQDGVFIFRLLERIPEREITGEDAYAIAMDEVKKKNIKNAKKEVERKTLEEYKKHFDVVIFEE
jgi:parvulin-like peptidyl-prolyl isomerase